MQVSMAGEFSLPSMEKTTPCGSGIPALLCARAVSTEAEKKATPGCMAGSQA